MMLAVACRYMLLKGEDEEERDSDLTGSECYLGSPRESKPQLLRERGLDLKGSECYLGGGMARRVPTSYQ
jgi:hypothetical protein